MKTSNGIEFNDVLRCFRGDMPAKASVGSNVEVTTLVVFVDHVSMYSDLAFVLRKPICSLDDHLSAFYGGVYATNTVSRPFDMLSTAEFAHELAVRNALWEPRIS